MMLETENVLVKVLPQAEHRVGPMKHMSYEMEINICLKENQYSKQLAM